VTLHEKQTTEFNLLSQETIAAVLDLHDPQGPAKETHETIAFTRQLEDRRKQLIGELRTLPSGDAPLRKFNAVEDAAALLAGTPVEGLVAPTATDRRATAERQLHAIEAAIDPARDLVREANLRVVSRESAKIAPVAREVLQEVVEAADTLLDALRAWGQFIRLLELRGYDLMGGRSGWMQMWPQESAWLAGDDRRPNLEHYIRTRREVAGLDVQAEKGTR